MSPPNTDATSLATIQGVQAQHCCCCCCFRENPATKTTPEPPEPAKLIAAEPETSPLSRFGAALAQAKPLPTAGSPALHTARGSRRAGHSRAEQPVGTDTALTFLRFAHMRKGHCSEDVPCVTVLPPRRHRDSPWGSCSTQHSPTHLGSAMCCCHTPMQMPIRHGFKLSFGLLWVTAPRLATRSPGLGPVRVPVCPPRGLGSSPDWFSSLPLPAGISPAEEVAQLAQSSARGKPAYTKPGTPAWACLSDSWPRCS